MNLANPRDPVQFTEEPAPWWFLPLLVAYILVAAFYFAWRFEVSQNQPLWFAIPLVAVELFSALTTILHLTLTRRLLHPIWTPPPEARTVDALIPTYNESTDIVEMTALGAMHICGIRHVFILDDGARPHIQELAERIGTRYLARNDNAHAKAGNMNHGLDHSNAEFVIFLDCDHVPQPDFIDRTLGYFQDDNLAFVQTPQVFYNFGSSIQFRKLPFRNLWNEQTMFYENIQPAKNRFNAAFFCGSGAILRRSALDSVSGFATGTATEDIHTSLRLHAAGWRSVFLNEQLAHGIAAEDFMEYHAQRVRWGAGSLGLLFRTSDSPLVKRGLTMWQRLCYLSSTNAYFYGGVVRLFYLVLPVVILFAVPFLSIENQTYFLSYLSVALPFFVLSIVVTYLCSRRTFHPIYSEQFNLANVLACLVALKGVVRVQKKFRVSLKSKHTRENPAAYSFIVAAAVLMGGANLFFFASAFVESNGALTGPPSQVIALALFWNSYNLAFVLSLARYLRSFHKRPAAHHAFNPHDTTVGLGTGETGHLRSVSFLGPSIELDAFPASSRIQIQINTRHGLLELAGNVVGRSASGARTIIEVAFQDVTVAHKRSLTHFFFQEVVPWSFDQERLVNAPDRTRSCRRRFGPARSSGNMSRSAIVATPPEGASHAPSPPLRQVRHDPLAQRDRGGINANPE